MFTPPPPPRTDVLLISNLAIDINPYDLRIKLILIKVQIRPTYHEVINDQNMLHSDCKGV